MFLRYLPQKNPGQGSYWRICLHWVNGMNLESCKPIIYTPCNPGTLKWDISKGTPKLAARKTDLRLTIPTRSWRRRAPKGMSPEKKKPHGSSDGFDLVKKIIQNWLLRGEGGITAGDRENEADRKRGNYLSGNKKLNKKWNQSKVGLMVNSIYLVIML